MIRNVAFTPIFLRKWIRKVNANFQVRPSSNSWWQVDWTSRNSSWFGRSPREPAMTTWSKKSSMLPWDLWHTCRMKCPPTKILSLWTWLRRCRGLMITSLRHRGRTPATRTSMIIGNLRPQVCNEPPLIITMWEGQWLAAASTRMLFPILMRWTLLISNLKSNNQHHLDQQQQGQTSSCSSNWRLHKKLQCGSWQRAIKEPIR